MFKKLQKAISRSFPRTYVLKTERSPEGIDGRLFSYTDSYSVISEQYRVLRTHLYNLSPVKPLRSILITSSQDQEGKSTTAANLAYTLSLDTRKKTILIDADFRKPTIHKFFSISKEPGFTDIILGKAAIEDFTEKPVIGGLHIIPSGSPVPNPSEIMASPQIKETIDKLTVKFDFVIFDSPPVLHVADASILGSLCDGVLLVVKSEMTQKSMIYDAFNALKAAHAKPKACIITNYNVWPSDYIYYRSYK